MHRYGGSWARSFIDAATDIQFYCDSQLILDATAKAGQPAYSYLLEHTPLILKVGGFTRNCTCCTWSTCSTCAKVGGLARSCTGLLRANWMHSLG